MPWRSQEYTCIYCLEIDENSASGLPNSSSFRPVLGQLCFLLSLSACLSFNGMSLWSRLCSRLFQAVWPSAVLKVRSIVALLAAAEKWSRDLLHLFRLGCITICHVQPACLWSRYALPCGLNGRKSLPQVQVCGFEANCLVLSSAGSITLAKHGCQTKPWKC